MRTFALLALVGAATASQKKPEYKFMEYIIQYGKNYQTVEEYTFRLEQFIAMDKKINRHNIMDNDFLLGHNQFSDWTDAEFNKILASRGPIPSQQPTYLPTQATNRTIDWITAGAVNAVQDQGQCGSCWAFSATAGMEGAYAVQSGNLLKFSEQLLVDCSTENSGCNGGMSYDAYHYYLTHGPMLETNYPYTAKDGVCLYDSGAALDVRTSGYVTVAFDDIAQMKAALALKPLNVSIQADSTVFRSYKSGIFNDPTCGNQHNHATNVVGMGIENGVEYWVMRNSWGTTWGEAGYMRMQIVDGDGQCGVQMWPIYPTLV